MFSTEEMVEDQMALLPDGRFCNVHAGDTSKSTFPPMVPLQYIGKKDCEGNELYVGDIMCWPQYENTKNQSRWVIEWDNEKGEYIKWHPEDKALRIGNIYQNPELLKP